VADELRALAGRVPGLTDGTPPLLLRTPSGQTLGIQSVGADSAADPPEGWRGQLSEAGGLSIASILAALAAVSCVLTVGHMAWSHWDDDDDDDDDEEEENGSEGGGEGGRGANSGAAAQGKASAPARML
jgi:hypothetical protein